MCGRYSLTSPVEAMRQLFDFDGRPNLPARYNIAPTQAIPIVRDLQAGDGRELVPARWGLVPSWTKEIRPGAALINARIETVLEKPSFRGAMKRRRCLIPADGFYEWRRRGGPKQPYRIMLGDGDLFAFAGIWECWNGPDGDMILSAAILTTEANAVIKDIHKRMPVILDPRDYQPWLDVNANPADAIGGLTPIPEIEFQTVEISTHVNKVGNDDPKCIEPLTVSPRLF